MTVAVLFTAAWHEPDVHAAAELTRHLAAQLRAAGARQVWVLARPGPAAVLRATGPSAADSPDVVADPPAVVDSPDVVADLRAVADLARQVDEPLLLCAGDLVAHDSLLRTVATEPAGRSCALVGTAGRADGAVREERGRVVASLPAAPSDVTGVFLGVLRVAAGDAGALVAAAARAAERADKGATGAVAVRAGTYAVDLLLREMVHAGLTPTAARVRLLHAERVTGAASLAAARAAVAAVDEDAALLRLAVKERDDFFTTYFVSSWSPLVTRWAARLGLTPTGVTAISVLFAVTAALAFWQASRPAMVAGAVLLYLGFVLDCVDGQLARYTRHFSAFGGWLDTMADRAKEFVVYAGLAAGAERIGLDGAWLLAVLAMVLQTVRHMTDTWYGALHDAALARPVSGPAGSAPAGGGLGARLGRASERVQADTGSVAYWLKRVVVFPIGERWALIAVVAAVSTGRSVLLAVLAWAALAAAYTLALRSLRSRTMRVPVLAGAATADHRDDGPLARRVLGRFRVPGPLPLAVLAVAAAAALAGGVIAGMVPTGAVTLPVAVTAAVVLGAALPARAPHTGALDWLVPAALRAAEYLFVVALGLAYAVPAPLMFALLFTLALHHYDLTARMEKGAPAGVPSRGNVGWDGRVLLLVAAALIGAPDAGAALLAGYVVLMFTIGSLASWLAPRGRPVPVPEGGPR